jgi:undecaprenyl diphosphate synthase
MPEYKKEGKLQHVAIVMDGNGRWAKRRGLSRLAGHQAGFKRIRSVAAAIQKHDIKYLTLYSFSTENWSRPAEEVKGILKILTDNIDSEAADMHKKGIQMRHIGRMSDLSPEIQQAIQRACDLTSKNRKMVLTFAFNYGGQTEILDAVKSISALRLPPEQIDRALFEKHLYTAGLPPVDLLIRPGGELRISNFMLWEAAYAEFYFTRVLWPDFTPKQVENAIQAFTLRQRRFGKVG